MLVTRTSPGANRDMYTRCEDVVAYILIIWLVRTCLKAMICCVQGRPERDTVLTSEAVGSKALLHITAGKESALAFSSSLISKLTLQLAFSYPLRRLKEALALLRKLAFMLTRLRAYQQETSPSHTKTLLDSMLSDQNTPYRECIMTK